jgi:hypothetical protein
MQFVHKSETESLNELRFFGHLSIFPCKQVVRSLGEIMKKQIGAGWRPGMEQRSSLDGRQVKCLIASEGHVWMKDYFDRLPSSVRRRLAESDFNICPACADEEANRVAKARGLQKPSVRVYLDVIKAIERELKQ